MLYLTGGLLAGLIIGAVSRDHLKVKHAEEILFWLAITGLTYTCFQVILFVVRNSVINY